MEEKGITPLFLHKFILYPFLLLLFHSFLKVPEFPLFQFLCDCGVNIQCDFTAAVAADFLYDLDIHPAFTSLVVNVWRREWQEKSGRSTGSFPPFKSCLLLQSLIILLSALFSVPWCCRFPKQLIKMKLMKPSTATLHFITFQYPSFQ